MKYGLLADIHESVEWLIAAIGHLEADEVDQVIVLGDVFETGSRLNGTTELLREARAIGVWGNHDFGLSYQPIDDVRARFYPDCMDFMTSLKPALEFEDCLVTHVEPYRDPFDLFELWSFENEAEISRSFEERTHRVMFHGHHHKWSARTPMGLLDWRGTSPLMLDPPNRYLIQVAALRDGNLAIYDSSTNILHPVQLRAEDHLRGRF